MKKINIPSILLVLSIFLMDTSCKETVYASDVIPFFDNFKLILGDGSNVGKPIDFENQAFFYTASDDHGDWVVFKAPNGGDTHGT